MSDDFKPEKLFNDIDKILEQQGIKPAASASAPVEIRADETQTVETKPDPELMNRIDNVMSGGSPSEPERVNEIESFREEKPLAEQMIESQNEEPEYRDPVSDSVIETEYNDTLPEAESVNEESILAYDGTIHEATNPSMFTTIDSPSDRIVGDKIVGGFEKPDLDEEDDLPPVSYLEGASLEGYSVENVSFGDVSVGVETESVEYNLGHPLLRLLRNILILVAAALLISLLVTKFVAHHTSVDGSSMVSTLEDGDQLIVEQISYYIHKPERYDVIVFPISKEDNYIKRVIGLPGETVRIHDGVVEINGKPLPDDIYGGRQLINDPGNAAEPIYLGENKYFVLGDNRNASIDSRFDEVGLIDGSVIKGKAWLRFYPFSKFGTID